MPIHSRTLATTAGCVATQVVIATGTLANAKAPVVAALQYVPIFIPLAFCTSSNAFNAFTFSHIQGSIFSIRAKRDSFHLLVIFEITESALSLSVPSDLYMSFLIDSQNCLSGAYFTSISFNQGSFWERNSSYLERNHCTILCQLLPTSLL